MKFEHWHFNSSVIMGDTIDRYPILDWTVFHANKIFQYRHSGAGPFKRGFTGEYYNAFMFKLVIARHEFGFRIEYGHGQTHPELAYQEYHARNRNKKELT